MKNPLIEMKEALEFGVRVMMAEIHTQSSAYPGEVDTFEDKGFYALRALESSGWNLDAIPELIEAAERLTEEGLSGCVSTARYFQTKIALAKLKERK